MVRGEKRQDIMDALSDFINEDNIAEDDITDRLKVFIDYIEGSLSNALDELTINDISQIGKIEDAQRIIDDLHDSIY